MIVALTRHGVARRKIESVAVKFYGVTYKGNAVLKVVAVNAAPIPASILGIEIVGDRRMSDSPPVAKAERRHLFDPLVVAVLKDAVSQRGTRMSVRPAEIIRAAPAALRRHVQVRGGSHMRSNIFFKALLHPPAVVTVIARTWEIVLHGM